MICRRYILPAMIAAMGLMLISASLPPEFDGEARRTVPKPPTECKDCRPAVANAGDCK